MDGLPLDVFAPYRRRTAATLSRWAAEVSLPPGIDPGLFTVTVPRSLSSCDLVIDAALARARTSSSSGPDPLDLARTIARDLAAEPSAAAVEVAGPGFVNVTLTPAASLAAVASILRAGFDRMATPADLPSALSPDEARALVAAEQVAALRAAARRSTLPGEPSGNAGPALSGDAGVGPRMGACHHGEETQDRLGEPTRSCSGRVVVRGAGMGGLTADAFRVAVASRRPDAILHIDANALMERSRDNPAFWLPYAHARLRGVLRCAAATLPDIDLRPSALSQADLSRLTHRGEVDLARLLARHGHRISTAAAGRAPQRLFTHLCDVATAIHSEWNRGKGQPQLRFVNEEERELIKARLGLVTASTLVLNAGLGLLGVTAPDEMG